MSTHPTSSLSFDAIMANTDLLIAVSSLEQALRVAELAHSGVCAVLKGLPSDTSVSEVRERMGDSLLLFSQALRLADERNRVVGELTYHLVNV
jgi:hypothetical protein